MRKLKLENKISIKRKQVLEELEKLKNNGGIKFPDYNPEPKKIEMLGRKQRKVRRELIKKEKDRLKPTIQSFKVYEYNKKPR